MGDRRTKADHELIEAMREVLDDVTGKTPLPVVAVVEDVDVKAIRKKLGLSQAKFAARFGFNVRVLQDWERKRHSPKGPVRAYLKVIERDPEAVEKALSAA